MLPVTNTTTYRRPQRVSVDGYDRPRNKINLCHLLISLSFVLSFTGMLLSGVFVAGYINTGCYSFVCNDWNLNDYTVIKYVDDPTASYKNDCDCNNCISHSYSCDCDLLKCYLIVGLNNSLNTYQVISDYSQSNVKGETMNKNNVWNYYDIHKYEINSTYTFYGRSYEQYCYLTNQVEKEGYYTYACIITLIVCGTTFILYILLFIFCNINRTYELSAEDINRMNLQ